MKISRNIKVLSDKEKEIIHEYSIKVLSEIGIRIDVDELIESCKAMGAKVDFTKKIVKFNKKLIEDTLSRVKEISKGLYSSGFKGYSISSFSLKSVSLRLGGACLYWYDSINKRAINPEYKDMIDMVRLGDAIDEVLTVGNPILSMEDKNGNKVPDEIIPLRNAEIIANNTSKPGSSEVWDYRQVKYLMEMGIVVRGSKEKYLENPCFVTAKETISPLALDNKAGKILMEYANVGLPCMIIPMPLTGATSPVTPASNIVIANSEILGVLTAIRCYKEEAIIGGGVITGILDMGTGTACFNAPESILQDLALYQLWRDYYDSGIILGVGYDDAKYPGVQSGIEKAFKALGIAAGAKPTGKTGLIEGKISIYGGILGSGTIFSPEQLIIDIDMYYQMKRYFDGIEVNENTIAFDLIKNVGISGSFLEQDHTLKNFKKFIYYPSVFDRSISNGLNEDKKKDIVDAARNRWKEILSKHSPFELEDYKRKEIRKIIEAAREELL